LKDGTASRMEWLREVPFPSAPRVILDGGGTANTTPNLLELFPGSLVVELNLERHQPEGPYDSVQGSLTHIPIKSSSLDLIFMGEVIEHIVDIPLLLDEVARVLKDGGHVAVTTPNLASWYSRLSLLVGLTPPLYTPYPHVRVGYLKAVTAGDRGIQDHMRVFTLRGLSEAMALHGLDTVMLGGRPYADNPRYGRLRRAAGHMLPPGWQEMITLVARVDKAAHRQKRAAPRPSAESAQPTKLQLRV
jgi:SAM-dependent methyltransferase